MRDATTTVIARLHELRDKLGQRPALVEVSRRSHTSMSWQAFVDEIDLRAEALASVANCSLPVILPASQDLSTVMDLFAALAADRTVIPVDPELVAADPALADPHVLAAELGPLSKDAAYALLTGGTTGRPKAVLRGQVHYAAPRYPSTLMKATGFVAGEPQLLVGGLYHVAPIEHLLQAVLSGSELVLPSELSETVLRRSLQHRPIGWLSLTPSHMAMLEPLLDDDLWDSLRGILHSAAPCPPRLKHRFIQALGAERVYEVYGTTEGIGLTMCRGDEWLRHEGTVGRGYMTRLQIRNNAGEAQHTGVDGRVFMRALTPIGVDGKPEDGWRTVEDRGRLDDDGYLFLSARADDLVQIGGENVRSNDVDRILLEHADVLDSATCAIPHDVLGHSLATAVQLRSGSALTVEDLKRALERRLPTQGRPGRLLVVDRVPRARSGKIRRYDLEALLASDHD